MKKITNNGAGAGHRALPQYFPSASTGLWLYTREWLPPSGKPKGVFFIVPGMGEHTIRYEFLAAQMGKIGFACYSLDHQGMGASEGDRCHVERFSHYVQDFNAFVAHVLTRPGYEKLPRFLFGHSVGGLISIHMTTSHDWKHPGGTDWTGVLLSAPCIVPDPKVSQWPKIPIGKLLSNVLPKFVVTEPLPTAGITSNEQVFDLYRSDPHLYHGGLPARWGIEMLFALIACQEELIVKFDSPSSSSTARPIIISPSGSEDFYSGRRRPTRRSSGTTTSATRSSTSRRKHATASSPTSPHGSNRDVSCARLGPSSPQVSALPSLGCVFAALQHVIWL